MVCCDAAPEFLATFILVYLRSMRNFFLWLFLAASTGLFAQQVQLSGAVLDTDQQPLVGASVVVAEGIGTITDLDGQFSLQADPGVYVLQVSYLGYQSYTDTILLAETGLILPPILLQAKVRELGMMVVSGSLYEKAIEREVVSVDIIGSGLIERTNARSLDEAVTKLPGVYMADGQANMRGGTGYSFGAGSRVMMVIDGQPLLTADRGDIKWTMMPLEITDQVEVIKGPASVLYGSGALNGVVHVRTIWPGEVPETNVLLYQGVYSDPKREIVQWWDHNPVFAGGRFSHSRKIGHIDLVVGGSLATDQSYLLEEKRNHARFNIKTRYRPPSLDGRLSMGINANSTYYNEGLFLLWADNNEGAYKALPNSSDVNNYLWNYIDPWITYFDKRGNRHSGKFRYNYNGNFYSASNRAHIQLLTGEYQFQREFKRGYTLTAGVNDLQAFINDNDLADHTANLLALFSQVDKTWDRLSVSAGVRWETFRLDDSAASALPVLKTGINYQVSKNNFLRVAFGQGYRFPSVGERFVDTDVGDLIFIFPNPELRPEIGWNAEIGIKQTLNGLAWKGYLDLTAFWTEYTDMTEFTFGIYPEGLGFKNLNVGNARIAGLEFTASGNGRIGQVPLYLIAGYTYVYPANLGVDTTLRAPGKFLEYFWRSFNGDDPDVFKTLLAYRFRHVAKLDVQAGYKRFTAGIDVQYFSYMQKIDQVFELFIPGIADFRATHNGGDWIVGGRASLELGESNTVTLLANNLLNREFSLRPGRMDAPRNIAVQYRMKF
ncbi:MAG: TonB-dependent receptor [Bacteroidetes bacterium]|nr:TonB-dependent receptor [Bacteroidota bacterium]